MKSVLQINGIEAKTCLGVFKEERQQLQVVRIDVVLQFHELPKACENDQLQDAVCYGDIVQKITAVCAEKTYLLIEHLCHSIHQALRANLADDTQLAVKLTKLTIPVPQIKAGASFCCMDEGMTVQW